MTDDQVFEALTAAASQDVAGEQAVEAPAPAVPTGDETPQVQPTAPEAPAEPLEASEDTDDGGQFFNPDALAPELMPAWKQLQAAYTRKTQELAEQRKQIEAFGSIEDLETAVDLYGRISDPSNWAQLHSELSEAMQQLGLTPAQADAAAAEAMSPSAPQPVNIPGLDELDDPELAPIANALRALQERESSIEARLAAFEAERAAQEEFAEAQRLHQERLAHLNEQVAAIREANPHYKDEDVAAIARLGSFFNDDLVAAQTYLEDYFADRMSRYFASKQAATAPSLQPPAGAGIESTRTEDPATLQDVEEGAVEYLRGLQAQGLLD